MLVGDKSLSKLQNQYILKGSSHKSFPNIQTSLKVVPKSLVSPRSEALDKPKQKKIIWKTSQKVMRQWELDLEKINKEEAFVRRNLKEINLKYQVIISKNSGILDSHELHEDKKQKEIERSLIYIDGILKGLRKKYRSLI